MSVEIAERTVRGSFHSLRIANRPTPHVCRVPQLVIFYNHSAWWDGILYLLLAKHVFGGRPAFIPINEVMLQRYPLASRVGAFGVEQTGLAGALQFKEGCRVVFAEEQNMLFVTPQGRFADSRERPLRLQAGMSHISQIAPRALFLPLAVEYTYWTEKQPELLVRCGEVVDSADVAGLEVTSRTAVFERALTSTMDRLQADSIRRDHGAFELLLTGARGINLIYDTWRRVRSWTTGQAHKPEHGSPP